MSRPLSWQAPPYHTAPLQTLQTPAGYQTAARAAVHQENRACSQTGLWLQTLLLGKNATFDSASLIRNISGGFLRDTAGLLAGLLRPGKERRAHDGLHVDYWFNSIEMYLDKCPE